MKKCTLMFCFMLGFLNIYSQCPRINFQSKNIYNLTFSRLIWNNCESNSITILGDLIEVDSIEIWSCERQIYSGKISNWKMDGKSFSVTLPSDANLKNLIFILNSCHFHFVLPENTKVIYLNGNPFSLLVEYYSAKEEEGGMIKEAYFKARYPDRFDH